MKKLPLLFIGGFIILTIITNSFFVLKQFEQAIITSFGEPKRALKEAGLKAKLPWEDVKIYDKRILHIQATFDKLKSLEARTIIADAFMKYQISDPLKTLERLRTQSRLELKLKNVLETSITKVLGATPLAALRTLERRKIMEKIRDFAKTQAKEFGIDVVDIRIIKTDFPRENNEKIFTLMKSEREKLAQEFRSEGKSDAQTIRVNAERERTVSLAEAKKKAEILKGQGDALASKIFADSYSRDPEFYKFYRSMEAYKKSLSANNTKLVISPDSEFFKFIGGGTSKKPSSSATVQNYINRIVTE